MNRIERNGRTYPAAWSDSDEHVIDDVKAHMSELLVEEFIWWTKLALVVAGTVVAAYLVGWGLAQVTP